MKINTQKTKYTIQAAIIVLVFVFLGPAASASEITPNNVIKYVNLARESQGRDDLLVNAKLMQVAKDKLDDMIANQYFAHTSPAGIEPWYWFQKEDYEYHYAGENLAINFTSAEDEQASWMASPTHRENILDPDYQEIGVAVGTETVDGQKSIVAVQEFGTTFTGVPAGEKNFVPFKNTDPKMDNGQIVPQVLSSKGVVPGQADLSGSGKLSDILEWSRNNRIEMIDQGLAATMLIMILCIALAAAAFLAVAADKVKAIIGAESGKRVVMSL